MSGDWIKMRADLRTHPKVVRISSALKADRLHVVGGLHAVWCLFDAHSTDGSLAGYTLEAVDDLVGSPGFARAMANVGWLEVSADDGIRLPEFDTHNGASAKRRAQDADRKRRDRDEAAATEKAIRDASASEADKKRTREEKRREEKRDTPSAPECLGVKELVAEGVDPKFARDWLKARKTKKLPLTESAWDLVKLEATKADMTPAQAVKHSAEIGWAGFKAVWLTEGAKTSGDVFQGAI